MITTIEYKYGFEYKNVRYAWKNKKLFRLPYTKNKRSYVLKEIPQYVFKCTVIYNVQRDKLTLNKLKFLTKKVDWRVDLVIEDEYPF